MTFWSAAHASLCSNAAFSIAKPAASRSNSPLICSRLKLSARASSSQPQSPASSTPSSSASSSNVTTICSSLSASIPTPSSNPSLPSRSQLWN